MRTVLAAGLLAISGFSCISARAEVVEASAAAMQIRHVVEIGAPPARVFRTFLAINRWWSDEHTYSGSAANLSLRAAPGGCFCERLPQGGGVVHMTVVNVAPNQRITLSGALGPLQTAGVAGALTVSLAPKDAGTEITLVYNVGGYYPSGLSSVAAGVDRVLQEQLERLKRQVETGKPAAGS